VGFKETNQLNKDTVELLKQNYQAFTVNGNGYIKNMKSEPVTIFISRSFHGTLEGTVGKRVSRNYIQDSVNPSTNVEWNLTLQPGKIEEINYKYVVLRKV